MPAGMRTSGGGRTLLNGAKAGRSSPGARGGEGHIRNSAQDIFRSREDWEYEESWQLIEETLRVCRVIFPIGQVGEPKDMMAQQPFASWFQRRRRVLPCVPKKNP